MAFLSWVILVKPGGECVVPPGQADGAVSAADCEYPSVEAAIADLYDAVIAECVVQSRSVTVSLRFEAAS